MLEKLLSISVEFEVMNIQNMMLLPLQFCEISLLERVTSSHPDNGLFGPKCCRITIQVI
jgi:hypothetical protein